MEISKLGKEDQVSNDVNQSNDEIGCNGVYQDTANESNGDVNQADVVWQRW